MSLFVILVSSACVCCFKGTDFLVSAAVFTVFACASSFFGLKAVTVAASLSGIAVFVFLTSEIWGITVSLMFTVFAVLAGLTGKEGVVRCGNIITPILLVFAVLSFIMPHEQLGCAQPLLLCYALLSGTAAGRLMQSRIKGVLISCTLGCAIGFGVRICGGVFGEVYRTAALFVSGCAQIAILTEECDGIQKRIQGRKR